MRLNIKLNSISNMVSELRYQIKYDGKYNIRHLFESKIRENLVFKRNKVFLNVK